MTCECVTPSACTETIRRARKPHECDECCLLIHVGERYVYTSGIWDGEPSSFHRHVECVEFSRAYKNHVREARQAEIKRNDDDRERAVVMGDLRAKAATYMHAANLYDDICDCVAIGELAEQLEAFCINVLGYCPEDGQPPRTIRFENGGAR